MLPSMSKIGKQGTKDLHAGLSNTAKSRVLERVKGGHRQSAKDGMVTERLEVLDECNVQASTKGKDVTSLRHAVIVGPEAFEQLVERLPIGHGIVSQSRGWVVLFEVAVQHVVP